MIQVNLAREKIEEMSKEQENLIEIFTEERDRRDGEEESLRRKLEVLPRSLNKPFSIITLFDYSFCMLMFHCRRRRTR